VVTDRRGRLCVTAGGLQYAICNHPTDKSPCKRSNDARSVGTYGMRSWSAVICNRRASRARYLCDRAQFLSTNEPPVRPSSNKPATIPYSTVQRTD